MNDYLPFDTPILFLVFNRPNTTKMVFERIREVKPKYLFIGADGPWTEMKSENELCQEVRQIATDIDWDSEVHTLFREENLGCGRAVSEAITWFFDHVEKGIILEDDCLPGTSFFYYCEELLKRYKNDMRIWQISGFNPLVQASEIRKSSYLFSEYGYIWGWATWRDRWLQYRYNYDEYTELRTSRSLKRIFGTKDQIEYAKRRISFLESGQVNTWDYQWEFTRKMQSGLCVIPNKNLVRNIGFGSDSTHTKKPFNINMKVDELIFPLIHPNGVYKDHIQDELFFETFISPSFVTRIKRRLKRHFKISYYYNK